MAEQLDQQLPATRNLHESLTRAEELATRRKHSVVGLDHLLLALGQDPDAVSVLLVCKVDVESLCMDLLRKLGPEARMRSPNTVPPSFDVTVQNLIAHASAAALQAGQTEIDGANVLSAIISGEGGMITHKILQKHGLTFNETVLNLEKKAPVNSEESAALKPVSDGAKEGNEGPAAPKEEPGEAYKLVPEVKPETTKEGYQPQNTPEEKATGQREQKVEGENLSEDLSIVQAEARPEDYGMTPEGSEYHPVPPKGDQALKHNQGNGQKAAQMNQHPEPPKDGALQKREGGARGQAQQMQMRIGPNGEQIAVPIAVPMAPPMSPEAQQRNVRQSQNLPPQNLQGQNFKGQMPPAGQPNLASHNQGLKEQNPNEQGLAEKDPLPTILNKQKDQQNPAEPNQKTRKVSFDPAELNEQSQSKTQAQQVDQGANLQNASPDNKFIQEDKYGTKPPSPPMPPHPGHVDLAQNPELKPQNDGVKKENAPLNLPPLAGEAMHPLAEHPDAANQIQANNNQLNKMPGNQFPANQPPSNKKATQQLAGQPIPGQNNPPPQAGQHPGQLLGQLSGQFPNQLSSQHPGQQPLPPKTLAQSQGQIQGKAQTQEVMNDIASSMAQSQKNRELLGDQDQVVENIPKVMRVGKVHYLEVRVAKFANTEIELAPEDYGLRSKQNNAPLTKAITVRLTGSDGAFLIDCATASTQWTEMQGGITNDADFAVWRWRVLPRKSGISKLRLDITARTSNEDGLTAEIPIQPSKSIDVKVTRNYASIFKKILIVAGVFAVGFAAAEYGLQAYEMLEDNIKEFSRKD